MGSLHSFYFFYRIAAGSILPGAVCHLASRFSLPEGFENPPVRLWVYGTVVNTGFWGHYFNFTRDSDILLYTILCDSYIVTPYVKSDCISSPWNAGIDIQKKKVLFQKKSNTTPFYTLYYIERKCSNIMMSDRKTFSSPSSEARCC